MELIIIPNFGERISPRIDYAESLQQIVVEGNKVVRKETIKILPQSHLDRANQLIRINPDIIICDGISNLLHDKLIKNGIKVIPWIHGNIEDIIKTYLEGKTIIKNTNTE